ncbi:MAG: signal recognition particle protein [Chloroflexi bacterium]|nr:signal recognition particle protein [Chloroflexota bacterium]
MFESLSDRLQHSFEQIRGKTRLDPEDVDAALAEIRSALIAADVNFRVVRDFVGKLRERALELEFRQGLTPAQQVVQLVHDELVALLGATQAPLNVEGPPPHVIMLVGLQGAGKTTAAGKLGLLLRNQKHRPLLVAADIYRAAAIQQLETLGHQLAIPVHSEGTQVRPEDICAHGVELARAQDYDVVILDTAGRLQIDEERMQEVQRMYERLHPQETLLVVDAMTGQEAVKVAQEFHRRVQVTGLILTRMDSDARGGAALSIRAVTGIPVKFLGTSERPDGLEPFYPDRLASRILGMGDVLTLIERTQETISQEQAKAMEKKLRTATFSFEDFYNQLQSMKRMGPLSQLLGMIPGLGSLVRNEEVASALDGKEMKRMEAIILSMTREERRYPDVIDSSRRRRIARGSGTSLQEVGQLIKQFDEMRRLMKELTNGRIPRGLSSMLGPMASAEMGATASAHRSSPKRAHREKPRPTPSSTARSTRKRKR